MPPVFIALVFGFLGVMAAWGICNALKTGAASSISGWAFQLDKNPVGFSLIVAMKGCFVIFGIAEILYAFGLVGDPFKAIQDALPFLARQRSVER